MPRVYKRALGSRQYKNYTIEALENALQEVVNGRMGIRQASREFKVPYGTLNNKYHGRHGLQHGGQTVFSRAEENAFVNAIAKSSDWGFPLNKKDLQIFVKSYLDRKDVVERRFVNNLPGDDWVDSFLKRHKDALSQRWAANIKRARAALTRDVIENYFANLKEVLRGVPASHVFNYDESNLSDDPGKKKAIFRRGVKYPERVVNFSKSATSIMMCGSASGILLPPFVIYKGEHLWNTWTEGGPKGKPCCSEPCCSAGTRYSRTQHGWIDAETFADWFAAAFLPHARRLEGRKVLIGDNLSSHLSADIIKNCEENNVSFVCLPPHSTHLLQPLDVAFFRPMKMAWRKVLFKWKVENPKGGVVPKEIFPKLLKQTLENMNDVVKKNDPGVSSAIKRDLISGFAATGIFPLDLHRVLKRIPDQDIDAPQMVAETLTDFLKNQRESGQTWKGNKKRKKLNVEPGKSITTVSSSEDEADVIIEESEPESDMSLESELPEYIGVTDEAIKPGQYALIKFEGAGKRMSTFYRYVCRIEEIISLPDEIVVSGMKSSIKMEAQIFRFVEKDRSVVKKEDIVCLLPEPKKVGTENRPEYKFDTMVDIKEY